MTILAGMSGQGIAVVEESATATKMIDDFEAAVRKARAAGDEGHRWLEFQSPVEDGGRKVRRRDDYITTIMLVKDAQIDVQSNLEVPKGLVVPA